MENNEKKICIVGAGASGCICAYFLNKANIEVTVYDISNPLRTILPTGGGRCNLSNAIFDMKDLAKNYPRGEKFLYSVFSKFSVYDTISLFEELGVKTYTQENGRIFPVSNSSKEVQRAVLNGIKNSKFVREKVFEIISSKYGFKVKTNKGTENYSHVVVAVGGHFGYSLLKHLNINIISPKPSLVGLRTKEDFGTISGVVVKNVEAKDFGLKDDVLFTHFGLSGPLIYTVSSINARKDFPYQLNFDLISDDYDLQNELNLNSHKDLKNILSEILPKNFVKYFLKKLNIDGEMKAHSVNKEIRERILSGLHNFEVVITGVDRGEETVTAGGVDLNDVIPQTLMSKKYQNLYFCGEVLDIDGFCGGFNLQNAWSTGFVVSQSIINNI